MTRISPAVMAKARIKINAMDMRQKELMLDEIYRDQPNILGLVLFQQRLHVSLEKMDFLLSLVLVCYQAMKDSGLKWPTISENDIKREMQRFAETVKLYSDLNTTLRAQSDRQYIKNHPEPALLSYIQSEAANWLNRIAPEDSDKNIIIAAMSFVNGIAYAPTGEHKPRK